MGLLGSILATFILAMLAPALVRRFDRGAAWLLGLLPLVLLFYFMSDVPILAGGDTVEFHAPWITALQLVIRLRLDGLGLLFALLITGVGAVVVVYSGGYMAHHPLRGRFHAFMLMFMGAMLVAVLADNLLLLYVGWELTSISSWLLIGFQHQDAKGRKAAWQALVITVTGGLALLVALVLLGDATQTYQLSRMLDQGTTVQASPHYHAMLLLVLLAAATKSAQFPFHVWLPNAMAAPTPVSAYLHSATMVTLGIYLLARLQPVLAGGQEWTWLVTGLGTTSMLAAGWMAVLQTDLKRLLAYTTVSALGMMVLLLGLNREHATQAALLFFLGHGLYKGALFLVAGAVDHEAGSRDVTELGSLRHVMPVTTVAAVLASWSMVGLPPTLGFMGHEALLEATHQPSGSMATALTALVTLASIFYVIAAAVTVIRPFFGGQARPLHPVHEAPPSMWLGPVALGCCGVLLSLFAQPLGHAVIAPATAAVVRHTVSTSLVLWHGFTWSFGLGMLSVGVGLVLYLGWDRLRNLASPLRWMGRMGPDRLYWWLVDALNALAKKQVQVLQHGYLPRYMLTTFISIGAAVGIVLLTTGRWSMHGFPGELGFREVLLAAVTVVGTLGSVLFQSRVSAVVCMGVVGYAVALFFVLFSAPDLAITQFLVETLFVLLVVLVLPGVARFTRLLNARVAVRNGVVAIAGGALVTLLLLSATSQSLDMSIPRYYGQHALESAHGRNVVNVILVDFRALDTLGEICVLGSAALGVFTVLRLRMEGR